jgi:hypothetical protein
VKETGYPMQHFDFDSRQKICEALALVESLDGFALYLVATRAARALVTHSYADSVEIRDGQTLTVVDKWGVRRAQLPGSPFVVVDVPRRRITDPPPPAADGPVSP